jgi:hypothetical protein
MRPGTSRFCGTYARWHDSKGGSVDHWMEIVAPDIRFGSLAQGAPDMRFATTYDSRSALRGYFDGLRSHAVRGWGVRLLALTNQHASPCQPP